MRITAFQCTRVVLFVFGLAYSARFLRLSRKR